MQIASVFDAVYQVSAPKNTRLFLESIDFDAWGDPYGNWGMGTLLAPSLVPIRSPPRAPPSRQRRRAPRLPPCPAQRAGPRRSAARLTRALTRNAQA